MNTVCDLITELQIARVDAPEKAIPKRSTLSLTKRVVNALRVDDKDAIFWDRDLVGFGVRVHANGRKVYVVQSRGPNGIKRVTLGPCADLPINQRRREAAAVIDRIKRGEDPMPAPPAPEPTVADLAERCMRAYVAVHCKPKTAEAYRASLDNHILPALGAMPLKAVGPRDVAALHHSLRDTPYTANQVIWVLSKMSSLAEVWDLIPPSRNPCRSVRRYRQKSRERFLTQEEFGRVGAALKEIDAEGSMWPPAIADLRLLMLTGCRMNEILTLQWDDVDRTVGKLRLRDSKSGPRMVPLSTPVEAVLDGIERIEGNPWVIRGRKPGERLPGLASYWSRIQARTGLYDVRIHDLRHTYASRALALGENLTMIGRLLGHTRVGTTARNAHLLQDAEKTAAARVGDSIGAHFPQLDPEAG